jgi:putative toxin-antitoxin system antitoxin component (TIGR02293 family)
MSYIAGTNVCGMIKKVKSKKYNPDNKKTMASEPLPVYRSVRQTPLVADFPYQKFEKIATRVPFTQKEWASILHLSEKTLQRYAKDNKNFEGIYVERILQMKELIEKGLKTFTSPEALYRWLKRDKPVLGALLTFDSLKTSEGIGLVEDEIGRIMYGVYI